MVQHFFLHFSPLNLKVAWNCHKNLSIFIRIPPKKDTPIFDSQILTLLWLRIKVFFRIFFFFFFFILMPTCRKFYFAFDTVYQIEIMYTAKKLQQKNWQKSLEEKTKFARQMLKFYDIFIKKCDILFHLNLTISKLSGSTYNSLSFAKQPMLHF